jgi:hypothetical protein
MGRNSYFRDNPRRFDLNPSGEVPIKSKIWKLPKYMSPVPFFSPTMIPHLRSQASVWGRYFSLRAVMTREMGVRRTR